MQDEMGKCECGKTATRHFSTAKSIIIFKFCDACWERVKRKMDEKDEMK